MDIVKLICAVLAGGVGGFAVPLIAQKVIDYKGKQKNREMPNQPGYLSSGLKAACAIFAMAGLAVCAYFQPPWILLVLTIIMWILGMVVIVVDVRVKLIPNEAVEILLGLSLVFRIVIAGPAGLLNSCLSLVAVMAVWIGLAFVMGFDKVGAGDVKLSGVIGFLYGFPDLMTPMLIMAVSLLVFCFGGILARKLNMRSLFAMAPFLVFGMLIGFPILFFMMN